ncbi:MAG: helix-turn-helix transcriptional regulator, partial [bacterium]|nr:helix-turn-helix transcriptional regulator [Candidatus Colisoma equi]
ELARRSGVPERTLARIECGDTGIRFKAFVAVCSALSLIGGFEALIPERGITPEEIVKGLRPRKRARKHERRAIEWGDEK